MTDCERIVPLLSLYLEGETSPAEATQVRGHLKACGACRTEYSEMKATVELVRALPRLEASDDFEVAVLARLRAAGVAEVGGHTPAARPDELLPVEAGRGVVLTADFGPERWWDGWLPRFAAAAAAAAVVALSMLSLHRTQNMVPVNPGSSSPKVAQRSTDGTGGDVITSPAPVGSGVGGSGVEVASLATGGARNPQYDDLRSRFPDIPAEVIGAMPLNGETYAADRMVAQPWSTGAGGQLVAPVDFHGEEKVYIYR